MKFSTDYRQTKCRKSCFVKGCDSKMNLQKNLSFHKLPKSGIEIERMNLFGINETLDKRAEWLRILGIRDINQELVICSKHFSTDDYWFSDEYAQHRVLRKNAIPRFVMEPQKCMQKETSRKQRKERLARRYSRKENIKSKPIKCRAMKKLNKNNDKLVEECKSQEVGENISIEAALNATLNGDENSIMDMNCSEINQHQDSPHEATVDFHDEEHQDSPHEATVDFHDEEHQDAPHEAVVEFHDEDCELFQHESDFDDSGIAKSNSKVTYEDKGVQVYTDDFTVTLSSFIESDKDLISLCNIKTFAILDELTGIMDEIYPVKRKRALSTRDSILLTTAKLKLDIPFAALSVFFKSVTSVTIRNSFYETLQKLSTILQTVIHKVTKEEIQRNMPKCFAKYQETTSVLDCTEIKIQTPKCLKCQVKFYSHYKSHLTVKFMTEVTPAGLLTFVSESFGGRASDKSIFNHSGILKHLESTRDAVMVDRGFLIDDACIERRVKLIRPPFLKNQEQLSKQEAGENRDIASARVHIERMNQRIKQFQILNHDFPWHMINHIDDVFIVCCGLANLDTPILADDKF